jgi:transcriptional regulator with XRE-family HTH domain
MQKKSAFTQPYKLFCLLLKKARKQAGLTQNDLACRLRRPQSYISKYETAERRLDVVEFLAIARVLSIDPHRLLKQIEKSL